MKKFAILLIAVGVIIFINVFFHISFSFWRVVELLIGLVFIFEGLTSFSGNRRSRIKLNINDKSVEFNEDTEKLIEDSLNEAEESIDSEEMPQFARGIAKGAIGITRKSLFSRKKLKKQIRDFIFYLTSGTIITMDVFNLYGMNFNFWEFILVIIGVFMIAQGITAFIPEGGAKK